jgi:hypothetical protein
MSRSNIILKAVACSIILCAVAGCRSDDQEKEGAPSVISLHEIMRVKEAHTEELMKIPGVVGVYIGTLENATPCIVVMITKQTPKVGENIPKTLDGFPVTTELTEEIKPME